LALIAPDSRCALCDQPLGPEPDWFITGSAFMSEVDLLRRFRKAPMHWRCYENWPAQPQFAEGAFRFALEMVKVSFSTALALTLPEVYVVVNAPRPVREVRIHLALTGTCLRMPLEQWPAWIGDLAVASEGRSAFEREALTTVWPQLRERLPDQAAIIEAVDWETVDRRQAELAQLRKARAAERAHEKRAELDLHNAECLQLNEAGAACPHCAAPSNHQFVDRRPADRSYFICRACDRSFVPITIRLKGHA
jgi:hypothetical protein